MNAFKYGCSVDARASAAPSSVNTVMNAVEAHVKGRKACVVFDEFQESST